MFVNAVGMHPDRLTNMYFAYVFVLRAIGKASPFLMVRVCVSCVCGCACALRPGNVCGFVVLLPLSS